MSKIVAVDGTPHAVSAMLNHSPKNEFSSRTKLDSSRSTSLLVAVREQRRNSAAARRSSIPEEWSESIASAHSVCAFIGRSLRPAVYATCRNATRSRGERQYSPTFPREMPLSALGKLVPLSRRGESTCHRKGAASPSGP